MPRAALEALSVEECVSHLDTDLVAGLTQAAAEKRRTEGRVDAAAGLRTPLPALVATVTSSLFARLLLGMALVNAAAAAAAWAGGAAGGEGLSAVLRETAAAAAFVCAPVVLALFVEGRLAACMERLQAEAPALCRVVRDGARKRVEAAELVAGDVLLCSEGDVVPADVRVVEVQAAPLRVDQSFLSGERFNVEKFVECSGGNDDAATRAYAETMLYKGSAVTSGGTLCLVCRVGGDTDEAKKLKHHAASKAMRLMLQPSFLFGAFYANASASALYSDGKTGQANIKTQEAAGFSVYAGGCFRVERRISEYVLRFQTLALLFCLGLFVCRLPGSDGAFAVLGHLHAAVWLYAASVGWLPLVEPAIPVLAALVQTEQGAACVVRRPQALEQLGRVEAVCCDVSGVLTEGVPVARELRTLRSGGDGGAVLQELHVRGVGYNPVDRAGWTGKGCDSCVDPSCLIFDGRSSAPVANPLEGNKALADLALAAALCNTARLEYRQDLNRCVAASPEHRPSPARASDAALLCLVEKLGSTSHPRNMELLLIERPERRVAACLGVWRQQHRTARSAPPTAERRCHSTLAVGAAGSRAPSVLLTKGAADSVLPLCVAAVTGAGEEVAMTVLLRSALETEVAALESAGMAVIATARRPLEEEELPEDGDVSKCERGLVFTGLIGVADTSRPRPQAATAALGTAHVVYVSEDAAGSAVHHLKAAGVVPGDATVDDLRRSGKIATANEFENLPESERPAAAQRLALISHATSSTRVRLVEALQGSGRVCAATGAGLSDLDALRHADVSLASATADGAPRLDTVANAADVTLADPTLGGVADALARGRAFTGTCTGYLLEATAVSALLLLAGPLGLPGAPSAPLPLVLLHALLKLCPAWTAAATASAAPAELSSRRAAQAVFLGAALAAAACCVHAAREAAGRGGGGGGGGAEEGFAFALLFTVGAQVLPARLPRSFDAAGLRAAGVAAPVAAAWVFVLLGMPGVAGLCGVPATREGDAAVLVAAAAAAACVRSLVATFGDSLVDAAAAAVGGAKGLLAKQKAKRS